MFRRIKDIREDNDLSQEFIADKLGCSRRNYSNIENGTSLITLSQLNAFANLFNRSTDYIVGLTNSKSLNEDNKDYNLKIISKRLIELRLEKGLSQMQIVEKVISVSQSTYSRYEDGISTIGILTLISLAKYYKVSLDYLLGRTDIRDKY